MKDFWEQRYREPIYAYGINPNEFFKEIIGQIPPGKVLLPAEGEGRNAVYAATKGWDVTAFDFSDEAKQKALELAKKNRVSIIYDTLDVRDFSAPDATYDLIGLSFTHIPAAFRPAFHQALVKSLRPAGRIVLEAFHKEQVQYTSGGPKDPTMLFSLEELRSEFAGLTFQTLEEKIVDLDEGPHHQGKAHVVRMVAVKE